MPTGGRGRRSGRRIGQRRVTVSQAALDDGRPESEIIPDERPLGTRPANLLHPRKIRSRQLAAEKQQGRSRVRGGRHMPRAEESGKECLNFSASHCRRVTATMEPDKGASPRSRVALAKKPDKSSNSIDVCLLGTQTIVLEANLAPYLIQQARCRGRLELRRYGVHFLGPTKKVQVTDEHQLSTSPVFLSSRFDG